MKKLIFMILCVLAVIAVDAQVLVRTVPLIQDTTGTNLIVGAYFRPTANEFFLPTEDGIVMFYYEAILAPAANQVMGQRRSTIFIPKDSIPILWNQAKEYYLNNLVPILTDSLLVKDTQWRDIFINQIE